MTLSSAHRQTDLLSSLDQKGLLSLAADADALEQLRAFRLPSSEELSELFPELEVEELLGTGGMGCVFRARQKKLDRVVAIKILPRELAQDDLFAERFAREARAMARLNHPNIVSIYDFGQAGDMYFLAMEYMDGMNLRELIDARALNPNEALGVFVQVCNALSYAHAEGVVHRDIKPENILFNKQGHVALADFGLARLAMDSNAEISITQTRQAMGTLNYMAPEQYENPKSVDHRADIYALGVLLYELMTGKIPRGSFPPVSSICPDGPAVDHIINKALQVSPDDRYAFVDLMLADGQESETGLLNGGLAANGTLTNFWNLGMAPLRVVGKLAEGRGEEKVPPVPPQRPRPPKRKLELHQLTFCVLCVVIIMQFFPWESTPNGVPALFQQSVYEEVPLILIPGIIALAGVITKYRDWMHPVRWFILVVLGACAVFGIFLTMHSPQTPAMISAFVLTYLGVEYLIFMFVCAIRLKQGLFSGWGKRR